MMGGIVEHISGASIEIAGLFVSSRSLCIVGTAVATYMDMMTLSGSSDSQPWDGWPADLFGFR